MDPEVPDGVEDHRQNSTTEKRPEIPLPLPLSHDEKLGMGIPPPPPLPPDAGRLPGHRRSVMQEKFLAADRVNHDQAPKEPPFKSCYLFFYGSLMDPEVLQAVLGLPELPVLQKGWVTGFTMKMWGIYPTLIPKDGDMKVSGAAWKVEDPLHLFHLMEYETAAYTWSLCTIHLYSGEVLPDSRTFSWAGDPGSKELEDGSFDLERYQKYFKASVVRKRLAA